jgi:hypothetical protein
METDNLLLATIQNRENPVHVQKPIPITSISEAPFH